MERGRGRGWGWALLMTLLVPGGSLRCPLCAPPPGGCRLLPCPSPLDACGRGTLSVLRGGRRLEQGEGRGCDVSTTPDVIITFRSHGEEVTLREERCRGGWGEEGEGQGQCPAPPPPSTLPHPRSSPAGSPPPPPLRCPTCDSAEGPCPSPPPELPCPRPTDQCIDVITRPPGGVGEGRVRGCGSFGPCRGLVALETGSGRAVALRCRPEADPPPSGLRCWGCDGPEPHGCDPQVLLCPGGLTHCARAHTYGPSGEPWQVWGCASPSWCETPVGLGGLRGEALPHCCQGDLCNAPHSAAPRLPHGHPMAPLPLFLLLLLLLAAPHI